MVLAGPAPAGQPFSPSCLAQGSKPYTYTTLPTQYLKPPKLLLTGESFTFPTVTFLTPNGQPTVEIKHLDHLASPWQQLSV